MSETDPPPDRPPTIADVAALAGVSRAVASRALSSAPRPVSADKRDRVLKAAEALGFRPNLLARSLTTKRVNVVAVVVNHLHDLSDLDLFDGLIGAIQAVGKQVLLIKVGSVDRVAEFLRDGVAHHVDAALVWSDFADAATARSMFRSDCVVMMNGRHDALSPAVIADEAVGIREAVADAASKGVRRAALITGRASSLVEAERVASYRAALDGHAIALTDVVRGDYSYESGHRAAAAFLKGEAPDAVFCTSDAMAMGVLDVCRADFPENRPTRFRLYGFDNISLTGFDAYPIASIGFDRTAFVSRIVRFVVDPGAFTPGDPPASVPTRFFPRATA